MNLDPNAQTSWRGFLDLLRPPAGYRLHTALGTTYGLSFDTLLAALLAMQDADADELTRDPVASVIAVTRLAPRVRVLLHPGTIQGSTEGLAPRMIGVLDRILVPVPVRTGLFHPKVWVLRFEPGADSAPDTRSQSIARVVVASRNLTRSQSFEIGVALDGARSEEASHLGTEVATAIEAWLEAAKPRRSAVDELPTFIRNIGFDAPREGESSLHFRWQGLGAKPIAKHLPQSLGNAVVVSPFLRADFIRIAMDRAKVLRIVSTREALSDLDGELLTAIETKELAQSTPVMFFVDELPGDPENGRIDGVHAKLLIASGGDRDVTFVGSANGTGPGWGLVGGNVEAMLELSPGLGVEAFERSFLFDEKKQPRPWIRPFQPSDRCVPSEDELAEKRLLAVLRRVGTVELDVTYESAAQRLVVSLAAGAVLPSAAAAAPACDVEIAPLAKQAMPSEWQPYSKLAAGPLFFGDVELADVSAFVAIRVREGDLERTRIALASLNLSNDTLDRRDEEVRAHVLANVRPEDVLRALVMGLAHLRRAGAGAAGGGRHRGGALKQLLAEVCLEQLLRAVAENPSMIRELRLLLGPTGDDEFRRFCLDLEAASAVMPVQHA